MARFFPELDEIVGEIGRFTDATGRSEIVCEIARYNGGQEKVHLTRKYVGAEGETRTRGLGRLHPDEIGELIELLQQSAEWFG